MKINIQPVETYNFTNKEDFQAYVSLQRKPLIIRDCDIGSCKQKWTLNYLIETLGKKDVKVHLSPVGRMNFIHKNFTYKTMSFKEFLFRSSQHTRFDNHESEFKPILCDNELLYLRSIGSDRRGKNVANFKQDFPQVADDVIYPDLFEESNFFSSILRIASQGVQIWTHYDVMDNALLQISGTKRVVLFSPDDTPYLYLNGDKSEVMDIDNPDVVLYPNFYKAVQHECILYPGDILYIPAFWFHNILCQSFSIGLNVFWKHLDNELYDKQDVYGNKDLLPAAKALEHIKKAACILKDLPGDCKTFYLYRCITELERTIEPIPTIKDMKKVAEHEEEISSTSKPSEDEFPSTSKPPQDEIPSYSKSLQTNIASTSYTCKSGNDFG